MLQRTRRALANLLRRSRGRDGEEQPTIAIEVNQRGSTASICLHAYRHRFRTVVFPLEEPASATVANARNVRGLPAHVIDRFALLAGGGAAPPFDDFAQGEFVIHHRVECHALVFHQLLQRFGLAQRAREAVQNKSSAAAQAATEFAHHLLDSLVWYECAPAHKLQGRSHGGGWPATVALAGGTENVAGRKVASPEALPEQVPL